MPHGKDLKRASLMPPANVMTYTTTHFYLFDDIEYPYHGNENTAAFRLHQRNCRLMSGFIRNHTKFVFHSVRFEDTGFNKHNFQEWWREELGQYNGDVLVVVYFHGDASGRIKNMKFTQRSFPRTLNAYKLFNIANAARPDILWILDCPFATRTWSDVPHKSGEYSHSEYSFAGQIVANTDWSTGSGDYTFQFTARLSEWVNGIDGPFAGFEKRHSLTEILRYFPHIASNPLRMWDRKTKRGVVRPVYRLCVDPIKTRGSGLIELERVLIQGKPPKGGWSKVTGATADDGATHQNATDSRVSSPDSPREDNDGVDTNPEDDAGVANFDALGTQHFKVEDNGPVNVTSNSNPVYVDLTADEEVYLDLSSDELQRVKDEFDEMMNQTSQGDGGLFVEA